MTRPSLLLGFTGLLLAVILVLEILPANGYVPGASPAALDSAERPATRPDAPPLDAWTDIVLSRPLFSPDRRPPASEAGPRLGLPRLAGTIGTGDAMLAIFQAEGGKAVTASTGAKVGDWTVAEITPGAVTLARGGSRATLRLRFADQKVSTPAPTRTEPMLLHEKRTNPFLQP